MNIAMYLRVSDSDLDLSETKYESDSIESQRILVLNYISNHPELIGEVKEYADDGYTGVNFNRPGFQAMINDVKKGSIDTIVTKDLSRLGREYIGLGDFLEQIFPLHEVRVIAINSHYDSKNHEGDVAGMVNSTSCIENGINNLKPQIIGNALAAFLKIPICFICSIFIKKWIYVIISNIIIMLISFVIQKKGLDNKLHQLESDWKE